jgi:hypothetical protein
LDVPPDLDPRGNDEHILYRLVVNRGIPLPDPLDKFRPVHGYHLSLNRVPLAAKEALDWGLKPEFLNSYLALRDSPIWREVYEHLDPSFLTVLQILEAVLESRSPDREIYRPVEARNLYRSLLGKETTSIDAEIEDEPKPNPEHWRAQLIKDRRFAEAIELHRGRLMADPLNAQLHHQMAWLHAAVKDFKSALVFESIAWELSPGVAPYGDACEKYRSTLEAREAPRQIDPNLPRANIFASGSTNSTELTESIGKFLARGAKSEQVYPSPTAQTFSRIFKEGLWKGSSVSGPGSSLQTTAIVRDGLKDLFSKLDIRSLCDAACGDAGWITEISSDLDYYFGFDVVEELIRENLSRHRQPNHFFRVADIAEDILPRADAIICRDCLVHLPLRTGTTAVGNFKRSRSKYLIATTFPSLLDNRDSAVGGWRPLNLTLPPYSFPQPIYLIRERRPDQTDRYNDKSLGVWQLSDL